MIKAINITKSYGDEVVFRDLSFEAYEGKFTIIQGKSGSGKTTLLNIISTIDRVDGQLRIKGVDISCMSEHKRAKFR